VHDLACWNRRSPRLITGAFSRPPDPDVKEVLLNSPIGESASLTLLVCSASLLTGDTSQPGRWSVPAAVSTGIGRLQFDCEGWPRPRVGLPTCGVLARRQDRTADMLLMSLD
jgi:hypothetical protein